MSLFTNLLPKQIGSLFQDYFTTNNNWNIVGSNNYTFTLNGLNVNGSNVTDYSNYINNSNLICDFSNHVLKLEMQVKDISSTSNGVGVGLASIHSNPVAKYTYLIEINFKNGIVSCYFTALGGFAGKILLSSEISCNIDDTIKMEFSVDKDLGSLTVVNSNTKAVSTAENSIFINTAKITLYSLGGNQLIKNLEVKGNSIKNPTIAFIGDSITWGAGASIPENSYVRVAAGNNSFLKIGGSGDRTLEAVQQTEFYKIIPKIVYIALGVNDIGQGVSQATWLNNLNTIKNYFPNSKVVFGKVTPNPYVDPTTWNAALVSQFGSINVFDTYTLLLGTGYNMNPSLTEDGTHPNDAGHLIYGNNLKTFVGL